MNKWNWIRSKEFFLSMMNQHLTNVQHKMVQFDQKKNSSMKMIFHFEFVDPIDEINNKQQTSIEERKFKLKENKLEMIEMSRTTFPLLMKISN